MEHVCARVVASSDPAAIAADRIGGSRCTQHARNTMISEAMTRFRSDELELLDPREKSLVESGDVHVSRAIIILVESIVVVDRKILTRIDIVY
jgi:hypothetical protein